MIFNPLVLITEYRNKFCRSAVLSILSFLLLTGAPLAVSDGSRFSPMERYLSTPEVVSSAQLAPIASSLELAGISKRKFLFFQVYDIALYLEGVAIENLTNSKLDFEQLIESISEELAEGKLIVIKYARDISAKKVKSVLLSGFQDNSSEQEWLLIEPTVSRVLASLGDDILEGDELRIEWLSDGQVSFYKNKYPVGSARHALFAKVLSRIWLGSKAVVDREELMSVLR